MKSPIAYKNGQFIPAEQLSIPVGDAGFVWGATVTDRVRTFNGQLFRLQDHLRRFRESCKWSRIPLVESDDQLTELSERLVNHNRGLPDEVVIWIATPGPLAAFSSFDQGSSRDRPTMIAYSLPINSGRRERLAKEGARLVTKAAELGVIPTVKHRSRLPWWIAQKYVHDDDPLAEPLFIDLSSGAILETPTSNVLAVVDGVVRTPPAGEVLEGVSLIVVTELCRNLGIPFVRDQLTRDELLVASEIMMANTTDCLVGVSSLDQQSVPFAGPVLNRLLDAWSDLVGVNLRELGGDGR